MKRYIILPATMLLIALSCLARQPERGYALVGTPLPKERSIYPPQSDTDSTGGPPSHSESDWTSK